MFGMVQEIETFKFLLDEIMKKLVSVEKVQNVILKDINGLKTESKKSGKKFEATYEAFNQIRVVSVSLVERLDEALGVVSDVQMDIPI